MPSKAPINEFGGFIENANLATVAGDFFSPGTNTYGSYTQLLAGSDMTNDGFGIWINFSNGSVSASARDTLAKIAVDPAGGTSFSGNDVITDLICSCSGNQSASNGGCGGIWYYFPLRFKAGCAIGVAASVNNATVGTMACYVKVPILPTHPELIRLGSFVRTFGSTPATSTGTAVTPNGSGSKSSYVQLGSSTVESLWFWNFGVGCNNNNMTNTSSFWDLAVGSSANKRLVVTNQLVMPGAVETMAYTSQGAYALTQSGDNVYVRAGASSASPSGMSAVAYGVGG